METVTRNSSRKQGQKKGAVKAAAKGESSGPVVDVPNAQQKKVAEFVKANKEKITHYMTTNFEEISEKDINEVAREVAECSILKRSPKVGGVWGSDTSIIEDVIKVVAGPTIATVDPEDEVIADLPTEEEEDGQQEESDTDAEGDTEETQETSQDDKALVSEPSKATKTKSTKSKTKPTKKIAAKTKPKAQEPKKSAKEKTDSIKAEKTSKTRMGGISADQIKSLKGKDQWLAAARLLKGQKKLWIQTQDIPDVIGHIYEVSIGKAKLKEEGFDGKGEKVYRRNRILGFKETIESFLKTLK